MRTDIVSTTVAGRRTGLRSRTKSHFRVRRWSRYDGHGRHMYDHDETVGRLSHSMEHVDLVVMELDGDREVLFDMEHLVLPSKGEAVHVLRHRIGFVEVSDLYEDRFRMITCEGDFPLRPVDAGWAILVAVLSAAVLIGSGNEEWWSLQWGVGIGIAAHAARLAHRLYVEKGLALLRWKAAQRIGRSLPKR